MKHIEFSWKNPKGLNVFAQAWLPDDARNKKPSAVILLIHGLGEHSSRYQHVAEFFTQKGVAVLTCDHVGHGKSAGKRGHIGTYAHFYDSIKKLHAEATRRYASVPIFLYGHSMGGGLAIDYLLQQKRTGLRGVIASSPMLEPAFSPPPLLLKVARLIRPIYPKFGQKNGLELKYISKDNAVLEAYQNDPLVHDSISVETAIGMLDSGKNSLKFSGQLSTPLLVVHGDKDGITSHQASERFAQQAKGDVTFRIWEGGYHELHNDPEQLDFLDYVYQWIRKRL